MAKASARKTNAYIRSAGTKLKDLFENTSEFYNHASKFFNIKIADNVPKVISLKDSFDDATEKDLEIFNQYKEMVSGHHLKSSGFTDRITSVYNIASMLVNFSSNEKYVLSLAEKEAHEKEELKEKKRSLIEKLTQTHHVSEFPYDLMSIPVSELEGKVVRKSIDELLLARRYADPEDLAPESGYVKPWVEHTLSEEANEGQLVLLSKALSAVSDKYMKISKYLTQNSNSLAFSLMSKITGEGKKIPYILERALRNENLTDPQRKAIEFSGKLEELGMHLIFHTDWKNVFANLSNHPAIIGEAYRGDPLLNPEVFMSNAMVDKYLELPPIEETARSFSPEITQEHIKKLYAGYGRKNVFMDPSRFKYLMESYLWGVKTKPNHPHPRVIDTMLYALQTKDSGFKEVLSRATPLADFMNF